ncbi:Alfa-L-rhamnosidase [Candidatus Burkholderia pumila]|uniref:Alfa-L-rhamnosidase n=1 Tax=Candidatus Burkholderia pumila TaxID=1090375 RepID=A0ABR5HLV1_9BURK|nr:Alfa-L-rhamnosidase [Candidatus Burkholderia pumila]
MTFRRFFLVFAAAFVSHAGAIPSVQDQTLTIGHLTVEDRAAPLGIDATHPRLSWTLQSSERDQKQAAYQIKVASSPAKLDKPDAWDSGKVKGDRSQFIAYGGAALQSRKQHYWTVRA